MSVPAMPDAVVEGITPAIESGQLEGGVVRVLFRQPGENGLSLIHAWFKPNYVLPRHSHDADCLYYVVSGKAILGSQELGPGDGFLVPADHPYAYRAGDEGVEVLEFRNAEHFNIRFLAGSAAFWSKALDTVRAERPNWAGQSRPQDLAGAPA